jgi:hypothetical protein
MKRALIAALPLALIASPVLAEEGVGTVGPGTAVVFWWGPWLLALSNAFAEAIMPVLVTAVLAYLAKNYPFVKAFLTDKFVNEQVKKAVDYALNAEAHAVQNGYVKVDMGPSALGTAVARLLEQANFNLIGKKALEWAGGPEALAKKAFRMMHFEAGVSAENVLVPVLQKIADGTLLPEKAASLKVIPTTPTKAVPKVPPAPIHKAAAAPVKPAIHH